MHVPYFSYRKIPLVSVSCLGAQVLIQRLGWKLRTFMSQLFVNTHAFLCICDHIYYKTRVLKKFLGSGFYAYSILVSPEVLHCPATM